MYDGFYGVNTISAIQNYCNLSPLQIHYDSPSQQCCSTANMINRWQAQQIINSLQAQMQSLKNSENAKKIINSIKPIKFEEEKVEDIVCENISDYMDKEFFYESELKEIEDKFHFKFDDLGFSDISTKDKIYIASMQIIEKLKDLELKYISNIDIIEFSFSTNSIYVTCNNNCIWDIEIESNDITNKNKDDVMNMCNKIIRMNIPEYQQFYEKYKNRIVKDNKYEDLSYYEKILKENC